MDSMNEKYAGGFLPFHPIVLLQDVVKRWLLILLAALTVGVAAYIYTDLTYTPVYRTTTTYVVTTYSSSATVYSNLSSASSLATVFSELLNSSVMRKAILQQTGAQSFGGSITASVIPETNLLTVTVTASDPRTAFAVAQAIIDHHETVTYQVLDSIALEVLQSPKVPTAPVNYANASGQMKRMMLYAAVATVVLLTLVSYSRNTIRSGKEVRAKLDCNFLGEIPHENKYKTLISRIRRRKTSILITSPVTSFRFVETIRKLRRRVEQHMRGGKVLMVTSLLENEGKSTIAVNLALAMVQKHEKVLLIDCDLRKPACWSRKIFPMVYVMCCLVRQSSMKPLFRIERATCTCFWRSGAMPIPVTLWRPVQWQSFWNGPGMNLILLYWIFPLWQRSPMLKVLLLMPMPASWLSGRILPMPMR